MSQLRHERHDTPESVDAEFKHIIELLSQLATFANRAPNTSDKGKLWVDQSGHKIYIKDQNDGSWTAEGT